MHKKTEYRIHKYNSTTLSAREREELASSVLHLQIHVVKSRLFINPRIAVARPPAVESDSSGHRSLARVRTWCTLHIGRSVDVWRQICACMEVGRSDARRRRDSYSLITQRHRNGRHQKLARS